MNPNINYGLWVCQHRSSLVKSLVSDVDKGAGDYTWGWGGEYGKISIALPQFCYKPKTALKTWSYQNKNTPSVWTICLPESYVNCFLSSQAAKK